MERPKKRIAHPGYYQGTHCCETCIKFNGYNQACSDWEKYHKQEIDKLEEQLKLANERLEDLTKFNRNMM